MNRAHYIAKGRDAYNSASLIIMPNRQPSRQRAAFRTGYNQAREAWRAAHPKANELDAMRKRNAATCRRMVTS